jgi:hypothetical protein
MNSIQNLLQILTYLKKRKEKKNDSKCCNHCHSEEIIKKKVDSCHSEGKKKVDSKYFNYSHSEEKTIENSMECDFVQLY